MQVLMPMAGRGLPFELAGNRFPKPLVELRGHPLVEYPIRSCAPRGEENRFVFVVNAEEERRHFLGDILRMLAPCCAVVPVRGETGGALCSALLAIDEIDHEAPLLVCNGDQWLPDGVDGALAHFAEQEADVGIVTFPAVHPRWSFVRLDEDGLVTETAEKRPISDQATVGVYWYRRAGDFFDSGFTSIRKHRTVNDQFYIVPSINELILAGKRVVPWAVEPRGFVPLGTPADVQDFLVRYLESPLDGEARG